MDIRVKGSTNITEYDQDGNAIGVTEIRTGGTAYREGTPTSTEIMHTALRLIGILEIKTDRPISVSVVTESSKHTINGLLVSNEELNRYTINTQGSTPQEFLGKAEPVKKISEINILKSRN